MYSSNNYNNNQIYTGAQWQQQYTHGATIHPNTTPYNPNFIQNLPQLTYFQRQKKYFAQFNTLLGGYFLLVISGYHIGWGVFNLMFSTRQQPWAEHETKDTIIMVLISWYIGSIVGGLLSILILERMGKKNIYFMMSILYLISSILLITLPENLSTIIVARSLAGLAHGVVWSTITGHAGEIATKDNRATLVQYIHLAIVAGLFSLVVLMSSFNHINNYNPNDTIGIAGILLSVIAAIFIFIYTLESPIYLINKNQEIQALQNLLKFNNETIITISINNQLYELKLMQDNEKHLSQSIIADGNLKPLLVGILARFFYALIFNYPINYIRMMSVVLFFNNNYYYYWTPTIMIAIRFISTFICHLTIEKSSRRNTFNNTAMLCFIATFSLATSYIFQPYNTGIYLLFICLVIDFLIGINIGTIPDLIASEAYPIKKKIISIVVGQIYENLLNICFICFTINITMSFNYLYVYLYITGTIMLILFLLIRNFLPETRNTTLIEAQNLYRRT